MRPALDANLISVSWINNASFFKKISESGESAEWERRTGLTANREYRDEMDCHAAIIAQNGKVRYRCIGCVDSMD
jgi:hypothetical protein